MPYPAAAARGRIVKGVGAPATPRYYIEFDGLTTAIDFGSNASLDNIFTGASITVDFWLLAREAPPYDGQNILEKSDGLGQYWSISLVNWDTYEVSVYIGTDDTYATTLVTRTWALDSWHHYAIAYSDTGDRKIYIAVDGVWVGVYFTQTAAIGNIVDDSGGSIIASSGVGSSLDGGIQWARISSGLRWTPGVNFVASVPVMCAPPAVDGTTLELWAMDEGAGVTAGASVVSPGNDGTITDGVWQTCV